MSDAPEDATPRPESAPRRRARPLPHRDPRSDPPLSHQLLKSWGVVRRWFWVPLVVCVVATVAVGVRRSREAPQFQTDGMVQIGMNAGMAMDPGEYVLWAAGRERIIRTQEKLLTSEAVVEIALRSLGEELPEGTGRRARIRAFLGGLKVVPIAETYLVRVEATGPDPQDLARRVNALMDAFIPFTNEFMVSRYQTMERQLAEQIDIIREKLRTAELKLQDFLAESGNVQFDQRRQSLLKQEHELELRLTELQVERASLEAEREMLERGLAETLDEEGLEILLGGLRSKTLQARLEPLAELRARLLRLGSELRPNHTEYVLLREQLASERQALRQVANSTLAALGLQEEVRAKEEEKLAGLLAELRQGIAGLDQQEGLHSSLQREVKWYDRELEATRARHRRAESRSQLDTGTTIIVRRAVVPASPQPKRLAAYLAMAGLLSLLGGFVLVFAIDRFEDTIANEEDARLLGPPLLGRIPDVDTRKEGELLVIRGGSSWAAEAFRDVRTHLMFSAAGLNRAAILVTSGGPRDGKTFVSLNLASAIARSGARTLLVDGDMRRPRLQKALGMANEAGLADVLVGRKPLTEVALRTELEGLDFLPSGPRPPNSSDLLSGLEFAQFVETALEEYEQVVIDSPPASVVSDSRLMARHTHGVVYVARLHYSRRHSLERAIEQIEDVGGKSLGLVLNGLTRLDQGYYYGYGYGRYGYAYGGDAREARSVEG